MEVQKPNLLNGNAQRKAVQRALEAGRLQAAKVQTAGQGGGEVKKPILKAWFQDSGTNDTVVDNFTGQVIRADKPAAIGATVKGAVKSSAAGFSNLGGTLLDLVNTGVDTAEHYPSDYAARQVKNTQRMLQTGKTTDGKALTPAMRKTLEENLEKYRKQAQEGPDQTFAERHPLLTSAQKGVQNAADDLAASARKDIAQAKEGLGTVGQFAVDAGAAGTQLAGDIGLALLTGGSALIPMAARGFGSGAQEARQSGADLGDQIVYGLGSAALSAATEKISNVAAPFRQVFGSGVADDLARRLVERVGENTAAQTMSRLSRSAAGRMAAAALGEGGEEFAEAVFQPVLQRATYDPDAAFDLSDALYQAAVGAVLGGAGGAVDAAGRRKSGAQAPMYAKENEDTSSKLDTAAGAAPNSTSKTLEPVSSFNFTIPRGADGVNEGQADPRDVDLVARVLGGAYPSGAAGEAGAHYDITPRLDAGIPQQQTAAPGGGAAVNENGLTALTDQERINLSSGQKNKIVSTFQEAVNFIKNALSNRQNVDRAYLGKVPDSTARMILEDTGIDITGYQAILHSDNVRHIIKNHGDAASEAARGQSAVTADDIALIPQVLSAPDHVRLSPNRDSRGRNVLVFEKQIGNQYVTMQAVSDGTHSLQTDTLYKQKRKGPHVTEYYDAGDVTGPAHNARSVPPQGLSYSDPTIPQGADGVNEGQIDPRDMDLVARVLGGAYPSGAAGEAGAHYDITPRLDAGIRGTETLRKSNTNAMMGAETAGQEAEYGSQTVQYGEGPGKDSPVQRVHSSGQGGDSRRTRTSETAADFAARNAAQGRITAVLGGRTYGFRRVEPREWSAYSRDCVDGFRRLGIPVEVMLGNLESNRGDVTVGTSGDAVTASDGTVFIKNDTQGFTPQEIVGHEGFHSMLKQQRSAALVYQETVMDQLSWSDPLAVEFLENITDHYFPNGYDAANAAQTAKFVDELSAYVSGMMNDGLDLSFLFRDYGRVRSDWEQMMGGASGDGNISGGQTDTHYKQKRKGPHVTEYYDAGDVTGPGLDGIGAADAGSLNTAYDNLQAQSSRFYPEGAYAARPVDVPMQDFDRRNVSKSASTVMGAKAIPDDVVSLIEQMVADGKLSYDVREDEASVSAASKAIESKGFDGALEAFRHAVNNGEVSKDIVTLGQELLNNAAKAKDGDTVAELLVLYQNLSTNAGQALQAMSIFRKLSPTNQLYGIRKTVDNLNAELKKVQKAAPDVTISRELVTKFLEQTDQAGRDAVMEEIYQNVADQVPSTWRDKWNAWRYLAMLGNPRTHIRNLAGNIGFQPLRMVKNGVAAAIESGLESAGLQLERTKSFGVSPALYRAAWNDYSNAKSVLSGSKYNDAKSQINDRRRVFSNSALEAARKGNSAALEFEDAIFKRITYADSLAGYLKANGVTASQLESGSVDSGLLSRARDYAGKEALKATYQDRNKVSDSVVKIANDLGVVGEAILPFTRTPANILARAAEYSPIGVAKSIYDGAAKAKTGDKSIGEVIDEAAAGLTGSGLLALGAYMFASGMVTGAQGDDKDDKWEELLGHQGYALELEGGTSITLDWLAPESLPFFMGVELMSAAGENGLDAESVWDALKATANPMLELSMLQSVNDLIESTQYAEDAPLPAMIPSAIVSYFSQAVPTLGGQIERTGESERMTTYTDKNSSIPTDLQYAIGRASSRIPGWDYQQIPYIDAWGRTESNGDPILNAANNFLIPAYTSQVEVDAVEKELQAVRDATGDTAVFPAAAQRYIEVDGERKDLTAEEYRQYARKLGTERYSLLQEAMQTSEYQGMSAQEKADYISDLYSYAGAVAKADVSSYQLEDWQKNAYTARQDIGVSPAEYIALYQKYGSSIMSGKAYEKTKEAVGLGLSVEQYAAAKDGMDANENGRITQAEAKTALDRQNLTTGQKADLWTIINSSWKTNPYR